MERRTSAFYVALMVGAIAAVPARASFTTNIAGYTASTFVNGFTQVGGVGPLGIGFPSAGGVLISDGAGDVFRLATDIDGQTVSGATAAQNYGVNQAIAMTQLNGVVYMTTGVGSTVLALNADGTLNHTVANIGETAGGIAADTSTGLLYALGGPTFIHKVDPNNSSNNGVLAAFGSTEGAVVDAANHILYAVGNGQIVGFDLTPGSTYGSVVFISGVISDPTGGAYGVALGYGSLAGNLFASTLGGDLIEVNIATKTQTMIGTADAGTVGFFATGDPNDGSLLLTEGTSIIRVTPPSGGSFSESFQGVPEPGSVFLVISGLLLCTARWRKHVGRG